MIEVKINRTASSRLRNLLPFGPDPQRSLFLLSVRSSLAYHYPPSVVKREQVGFHNPLNPKIWWRQSNNPFDDRRFPQNSQLADGISAATALKQDVL